MTVEELADELKELIEDDRGDLEIWLEDQEFSYRMSDVHVENVDRKKKSERVLFN